MGSGIAAIFMLLVGFLLNRDGYMIVGGLLAISSEIACLTAEIKKWRNK